MTGNYGETASMFSFAFNGWVNSTGKKTPLDRFQHLLLSLVSVTYNISLSVRTARQQCLEHNTIHKYYNNYKVRVLM